MFTSGAATHAALPAVEAHPLPQGGETLPSCHYHVVREESVLFGSAAALTGLRAGALAKAKRSSRKGKGLVRLRGQSQKALS